MSQRSASRPTVEELGDPSRFAPILSFGHDEIPEVARGLLWKRAPLTVAYVLANAAAGAAVAYLWARSGLAFDDAFSRFCLGAVAGFVALLPLHEWAHALAYRAVGATDTRVVYRLRNLTAYCVADGFVVDGRAFAAVCLAPFVLINTALFAAIVAVGGFSPMLWGALVLHIGACSGDVAFANMAWLHRDQEIYTYDDVPAERSHFYAPAP